MRGYKIALMGLALALLAPAALACCGCGGGVGGEKFDGFHWPTMKDDDGAIFERSPAETGFAGVREPTMTDDGHMGGHGCSPAFDRWICIGREVKPDPNFGDLVKAHQEEFNLVKAVFGCGP